MDDLRPTRKVGAAGLGGAVAVIVVWVLGAAGVEVPIGVEGAITAVLAFGAGYLVREG